MELLKELVLLVKDLPDLALYVLAMFFAYKVIVIGSVYGVIRFCTEKICNMMSSRKENIVMNWQGLSFSYLVEEKDLALIVKRAVRREGSYSNYIKEDDIAWLKSAVEEKIAREK